MQQIDFEEAERVLSAPTLVELSVNDLRILVGALDGLTYFETIQSEDYLDPDGIRLRARLKANYEKIVQDKFPPREFLQVT